MPTCFMSLARDDARTRGRKTSGTRAVAYRAHDRRVGELAALLNAPQHQASPTHVAPADEVRGKEDALGEDGGEHVHVLRGRDAAEKDDLRVRPRGGERLQVAQQGTAVAGL